MRPPVPVSHSRRIDIMQATLIYPHQLYEHHPGLTDRCDCVLVEDPLFFTHERFHFQKLVLHRAAFAEYARVCERRGHRVHVAPSRELRTTGDLAQWLQQRGYTEVRVVDPCDDWLERRLRAGLTQARIGLTVLPDPHFLTSRDQLSEFAEGNARWYFTDFYIRQRRRCEVLLTPGGKPVGGQWSFDPENRRKLPEGFPVPAREVPRRRPSVTAACDSVAEEFAGAPGTGTAFEWPVTHAAARSALTEFVEQRFAHFGDYEDAIDRGQTVLFHSVLTPALNIGLLSPRDLLDAALAHEGRVPLNSLEGFVRQVLGWREYMRGVYLHLGRAQRVSNFFDHRLPMPAACYDGTTGLPPVDTVIARVLKHGWCHHIERLMVLGNFFLLCEIDPTAVYRWFMELFVDAYDWVMVPNVYGMSQYADGGRITTKPYISGSSYLKRMSNFGSGPWCAVWDALYWRFVSKHRDFFAGNPRMSMMAAQCRKLGPKLEEHERVANEFLERLHAGQH